MVARGPWVRYADQDVGVDCQAANGGKGDGMTKQSFTKECDINYIVARFEKTGLLPDIIKSNPQYGDFANVLDYKQGLELVMRAEEQFDALSWKVRERFHNNPAEFLEFCNDPNNGKEMVELGLAIERKSDASVASADVVGSGGKPVGAPADAGGQAGGDTGAGKAAGAK